MANHLTEFQMNQYFGWIQGSDMPSTYVHMSGKNVDEALLRMNGVAVEVNKNKTPSKDWLRFVKTSLAKSHIKKLTEQDKFSFKLED